MNKKKYACLSFLFLFILVFISNCGVNEPDKMTPPGRFKVNLLFKASKSYNIQPTDSLFIQASNFILFKDTYYANVFQNPNQFLQYNDSIVGFNMLEAAYLDSSIQVANGSVAALQYDSLLFQMSPGDQVRLNSKLYPISTDYKNLGAINNFSTIVKINHKINVYENRTTTINIVFFIDNNVFRYLDQFIYDAKVDTFYFSN